MKTQEQIIAEATKVKNMGSPLSLEQIIATIERVEARQEKKFLSKKEIAKAQSRANVEKTDNSNFLTSSMGEINRANALKNLPSSMR